MHRTLRRIGLAVSLSGALGFSASAHAAESVNFILNWIAGGDHAPYYYAKKMGLYAEAGIDLDIEQGKGSSMSFAAHGNRQEPHRPRRSRHRAGHQGQGRRPGRGHERLRQLALRHVLAEELRHRGPKGLAGHKIGNPPWDAARQMWPALAKAVGMDPGSVTWVNVQPNAKLSALKSGSIHATTSFYNIHHIFQRELGDDMGFFPWKQYGINPYGNSIIVNGEYLKANRAVVGAFVEVTQKAFHTCVTTPEPCIDALVEANKGLKKDNELQNWALVVELMTDETSQTVALGHFDDARMKNDYTLIETYFNLETPFDITATYTNEFLDTGIRMP